ncbi:RAVE protein 1 C terminal-domain-containing protein [Protomyces lactucae-debilis]|uniref:RAVE protein 1 C terminal-domain-containing protein n=1 Tax=Protomyces lactucae-debilis TaxID=2754530 RepID=A0A1Y2FVF7_PROLT|nr:RAVE protein 1 C terminal-domain-containing protein [Protomyces lactucae-debilis]ORY87949.1 RAVE protein 1 C terminal-domain-containing protein [Protomyces lactucae-debilis]
MPCTWSSSGKPNPGPQSLATAVRHGILYTAVACGSKLLLYRHTIQLVQLIDTQRYIDRLAFDRRTGCIAIANGAALQLYHERYASFEETISWDLSHTASLDGGPITSLSWGQGRELLVGNSTLSLHIPSSQTSGIDRIWRFPLSDACSSALFSPDASLIASFQQADRAIKVWRRLPDRTLQGGARQADFDFLYLPHPRPLTAMKWRQPFREDVTVDNILYTCCMDGFLRIWASDVPHDSHLLTLHETIDLREGTSLQVPVVLDDDVFSWAAHKASRRSKQAQKLLAEINQGAPELVLLLSLRGCLDVYGCYHLGSRTHKPSSQRLVYSSDTKVIDSPPLQWMTADICREGEDDLLFYGASDENVTAYSVKLDQLLQAGALQPIGVYGGHTTVITSLQQTPIGFCSTAESQLYWKLDSGLYCDYSQNEATADQPLPDYLGPVKVFSQNGEYTAMASPTSSSVLQIYHTDESLYTVSQLPEYTVRLPGFIQQLCWSSLADDGCMVLGICIQTTTSHQLLVYKPDHATTWQRSWHKDMSDLTKDAVTALCWTRNTEELSLVAAAGSQLFLFDQPGLKQQAKQGSIEQLAVYHPIMIEQLILRSGRSRSASAILGMLYEQLIASQTVEPMLGLDSYAAIDALEATQLLDAAKVDSLCSLLSEQILEIPGLSSAERNTLSIWAQVVVQLQAKEAILDEMGIRFASSFLYHTLTETTGYLTSTASLYAYLSQSQDALVDLITGDAGGLTWQQADRSGCVSWIRDATLLTRIGDVVARNEYLAGDTITSETPRKERDPVAASLWMHALHQRTQLVSLWRISQHLKESGPTMRLLQNDFMNARWRTSASKNAFALLGKQRDVYAAAWFLLAGKPDDARRVLVKYCKRCEHEYPWRLALAVLRLFDATTIEPGAHAALQQCFQEDVQPDGQQRGDLFLLVQVQLMLGNEREAMSLLLGEGDLRELAGPEAVAGDAVARYTLFAALRARLHQADIASKEKQLKQLACRQLKRKGCSLLADALEKTELQVLDAPKLNGIVKEPLKDDKRTLESFLEAQKGKLSEAPKAVFEEPTMDSFAAFDF